MRIFGAPCRYMQGPGALDALGAALAQHGARAAAVVDPFALEAYGEAMARSARDAGVAFAAHAFGGECTAGEIDRLTAAADAPDVVLAVGGGKAIDTGKGVAQAHGRPLVVVPTIASNDAPTSTVIVVYDDTHRIAEVRRTRRNPDTVLVDTAVIAAAPARFLRAGIGDGLSKTFEAHQCAAAGGQNFFGGRATLAALTLAERCYHVLRDDAEAALAAVERKTPDAALERVVEAAVLLSGLGFENGGLSLAHALQRGLAADARLAHVLHGELVAYALLVQLALERRPTDEIADLRAFYRRIGLPVRLADLGAPDVGDDLRRTMGELTMAAPYIGNFQRALSAHDIAAAIAEVEGANT